METLQDGTKKLHVQWVEVVVGCTLICYGEGCKPKLTEAGHNANMTV